MKVEREMREMKELGMFVVCQMKRNVGIYSG